MDGDEGGDVAEEGVAALQDGGDLLVVEDDAAVDGLGVGREAGAQGVGVQGSQGDDEAPPEALDALDGAAEAAVVRGAEAEEATL